MIEFTDKQQGDAERLIIGQLKNLKLSSCFMAKCQRNKHMKGITFILCSFFLSSINATTLVSKKYNPSMSLGDSIAWENSIQAVKLENCYDYSNSENTQVTSPTLKYKGQFVSNEKSRFRSLSSTSNASANVGFGAFFSMGGSGSSNQKYDEKGSDNFIAYEVTYEATYDINKGSVKLKPEYESLAEKSPSEFIERCGTDTIIGGQKGYELSVRLYLDVSSLTMDNKASSTGSMNISGAYKLFSGGASSSSSSSSHIIDNIKNFAVDVSYTGSLLGLLTDLTDNHKATCEPDCPSNSINGDFIDLKNLSSDSFQDLHQWLLKNIIPKASFEKAPILYWVTSNNLLDISFSARSKYAFFREQIVSQKEQLEYIKDYYHNLGDILLAFKRNNISLPSDLKSKIDGEYKKIRDWARKNIVLVRTACLIIEEGNGCDLTFPMLDPELMDLALGYPIKFTKYSDDEISFYVKGKQFIKSIEIVNNCVLPNAQSALFKQRIYQKPDLLSRASGIDLPFIRATIGTPFFMDFKQFWVEGFDNVNNHFFQTPTPLFDGRINQYAPQFEYINYGKLTLSEFDDSIIKFTINSSEQVPNKNRLSSQLSCARKIFDEKGINEFLRKAPTFHPKFVKASGYLPDQLLVTDILGRSRYFPLFKASYFYANESQLKGATDAWSSFILKRDPVWSLNACDKIIARREIRQNCSSEDYLNDRVETMMMYYNLAICTTENSCRI